MSMQGSRPVRTAGFVMIGVAVVAVGLGVFALTSNGSGQAAAGRPPVTTTPATTKQPVTTTHPTTTTPSFPSGQTTTVAPPPTTTSANPLQGVPVRVYNNSKIPDLAMTAAQDFRNAGFNVVLVGNYPQGILPHSAAFFSPAPGEQAVATQLAHDFNMQVQPRFPGIAFASPGVIVIVTKDFQAGK
jgi:LytR cell envelope-related transcriptional attenuator